MALKIRVGPTRAQEEDAVRRIARQAEELSHRRLPMEADAMMRTECAYCNQKLWYSPNRGFGNETGYPLCEEHERQHVAREALRRRREELEAQKLEGELARLDQVLREHEEHKPSVVDVF